MKQNYYAVKFNAEFQTQKIQGRIYNPDYDPKDVVETECAIVKIKG